MKEKGWLKENITSLLAILWSVAAISMNVIILTKDIKADDKVTYLLLSNQNSIVLLILGYYYVSSKIISDKQNKAEDKPKEVAPADSTQEPKS